MRVIIKYARCGVFGHVYWNVNEEKLIGDKFHWVLDGYN
jgi:hypothetical protein